MAVTSNSATGSSKLHTGALAVMKAFGPSLSSRRLHRENPHPPRAGIGIRCRPFRELSADSFSGPEGRRRGRPDGRGTMVRSAPPSLDPHGPLRRRARGAQAHQSQPFRSGDPGRRAQASVRRLSRFGGCASAQAVGGSGAPVPPFRSPPASAPRRSRARAAASACGPSTRAALAHRSAIRQKRRRCNESRHLPDQRLVAPARGAA